MKSPRSICRNRATSSGLKNFPPRRFSSKKNALGLDPRLHEFAVNVEAEKLNVQTTRGTVEARQNRLREIQEELNQASREQDHHLQAQAEKRSRLDSA